jgi:GntR family transcriptional regulator
MTAVAIQPPRTRYLQVAEALRRQIEAQAPNSLLPTEQQLARRFEVSRVTVRRALGLLERSGLVSRQRGRGTIISPPKITRRLAPLRSFEEDLWDQGVQFETQVLAFEPEAACPDFARSLLRLPPDATVGFLSLLRLVDDRIVAHDRRHLAPTVAARFEPARVRDRAISAILSELAGSPVAWVDWESEIVPAVPEVAGVLGLIPGTLIVANTFTYYLEDGRPVEAGVMSYRVDRCKFKFAGGFMRPVSR